MDDGVASSGLEKVVSQVFGSQANVTDEAEDPAGDELAFDGADRAFEHGLDANPYFNHSAKVDNVDPFSEWGDKLLHADASSCQRALYQTVSAGSTVRTWDVLILLPNAIFLLFLLFKLKAARQKLRATNAPIFKAFYLLVLGSAAVGTARALVSMTVAPRAGAAVADKLLWLLLRFCLLATEISVLVFGLASGHLDSRRSIRRVVAVSALVSLAFSTTQAIFEFQVSDPNFRVQLGGRKDMDATLDLFGHGGALFWLVASALSTVIYLIVLLLPFLPCRHALTLPHKKTFYQYVGYLLLLNAAQTIGCILLYSGLNGGLCLVNLTTYLYFTTFAPLVYFTFLQGFFRTAQPQLLFSYKAQMDEFEDDLDHTIPGLAQSSSLQFRDDVDNVNPEENPPGRPIVMNLNREPNVSDGVVGVASPESVENYNFRSP